MEAHTKNTYSLDEMNYSDVYKFIELIDYFIEDPRPSNAGIDWHIATRRQLVELIGDK